MPVRGSILANSTANENRRAFSSSARQVQPQQITRTPPGRPGRTTRPQLAETEHDGEDRGSWLPWPSMAHGVTVYIVLTDSTDCVAVDTATRRLKTLRRQPRVQCKQLPRPAETWADCLHWLHGQRHGTGA